MVRNQRGLDAIERERRRRERAGQDVAGRPSPPAAPDRRSAARSCVWCRGAIDVKPLGRIPKWCSATCRQRAWELRRAAASGRAAVEIVERLVAVPTPTRSAPAHGEWVDLLHELAAQLDAGRIYDRELVDLAAALRELRAAWTRRW